ncbi:MAG TPA: hypothetical protein VGN52_18910 [Burkholderiales bacterium]
MSLAAIRNDLAALHTADGSAAPSWFDARVLFAWRAQCLLLPSRDSQLAHAAVGFFIGSLHWRALGHLLVAVDRWLPGLKLLPRLRWEGFPAAELFGVEAQPQACAVLCGTPGPLRKLTVLHRPPQGEPAVAKLALRVTADEAIGLEQGWLEELGVAPELAPFIPRLLRAGALPGGRRYVTTSVLPTGHAAFRFGGAHRQFLGELGAHGDVHPWADSAAFERLRERARAVEPLMDARYRRLIGTAVNDIERRIGARTLPACLAHGDFAPWNVRVRDGRLFAFDWEYAQAGANPLHDFLHFHLMGRLARHRAVGARAMALVLSRAGQHADAVFGARSGVAQAAGPLALHYLLEVVTFYVAASRRLDPRHPVLRAYLGLVEQRGRWLDARPPTGDIA